MADDATFRRGAKDFPLDTGTGNSLLLDADPLMFYAGEFFAQVIETHAGPRLMEACGTPPAVTSIQRPVAGVTAIDPVPFLLTAQFDFPLLAVYRRRSILEDRTVAWRHDVSTFEILYVLPPLMASEAERVGPILTAIRDILDDRADTGLDPTYQPTNGVLGESFWVSRAGAERVSIKEAEWGLILAKGELGFYGIRLRAECAERANTPSKGLTVFEGVDATVDVAAPDETIVTVAEQSTLQPPTVTTVAPASGAYTGGVSVTLTGTNFADPDVAVLIGGKLATDVVVVSSTSITCKTPAHDAQAVGTALDVVVATQYGSGSKLDAFTLT